jgi:SAM-dependent methyltransferase
MGLYEDFLQHRGRLVHKWIGYFPAYEAHFSRFRDKPVLMIEIGCGQGGSLQMWKRWLGPQARIVGIDIRPACKEYEEERISVRIGDQGDPGFLKELVDEFGAPDIVLDDGSHLMKHMRASFDHLYPLVSPHGVYAVEDMHTCYSEKYGGGYKSQDSFWEFVKDKIDELNAHRTRGAVKPSPFTKSTRSIHAYESIVVFERFPYQKSVSMQIAG